MTESEYEARIKALEEAQKRDQNKIARLEAQNDSLKSKHKADKAEIKNLKRRKDPKSKKKDRKEPRVITITEEQRQLLSNALPDIDILSLL